MHKLSIDEILTRGVANIISSKENLKKLLLSDKKLNVYLGIDPTATKIHLGNAVQLRKLQAFADLGHNVTLIIGDFTALIGDTSDKDTERPSLTYEQIQDNFNTYKQQAEKIVDFSNISIKYNSEWLNKLTFADIVKLCHCFSIGDFISRELIRKRLNTKGSRVGLHEVLYPVMQGYDSYFLDTDIQLGGTDQTFNMQAGRTLQKLLRNKDSYVLAGEFLDGTDGRKMSKSWGNAIWLEDSPSEMYGKVMSVRDELIIKYFLLATNISQKEIEEKQVRLKQGENPIYLKKELATQIVQELHGSAEAQDAQIAFENTFQKGNVNADELEIIKLNTASLSILDLLTNANLAESKSEAKRLITNNAIEIDGQVVSDPKQIIYLTDKPIVVKVGKKKFVKISNL